MDQDQLRSLFEQVQIGRHKIALNVLVLLRDSQSLFRIARVISAVLILWIDGPGSAPFLVRAGSDRKAQNSPKRAGTFARFTVIIPNCKGDKRRFDTLD